MRYRRRYHASSTSRKPGTSVSLRGALGNCTCVHKSFLASAHPLTFSYTLLARAFVVETNTFPVSSLGVHGSPPACSIIHHRWCGGCSWEWFGPRAADGVRRRYRQLLALKRLFRSAALINSRPGVSASVKRAQALRRYIVASRGHPRWLP